MFCLAVDLCCCNLWMGGGWIGRVGGGVAVGFGWLLTFSSCCCKGIDRDRRTACFAVIASAVLEGAGVLR